MAFAEPISTPPQNPPNCTYSFPLQEYMNCKYFVYVSITEVSPATSDLRMLNIGHGSASKPFVMAQIMHVGLPLNIFSH